MRAIVMGTRSTRKKSHSYSSSTDPTGKSNLRPHPHTTIYQPPPPITAMYPLKFTLKRAAAALISVVAMISVFFLLVISSNSWGATVSINVQDLLYSIQVVHEFPHDPNAFTQGLLYGGNEHLFESTGLYSRSSVRRVALHTGKILDMQKMKDSYFGEGLTLFGQRLFQVTWLQKTGFIYDRNNLSKFEEFTNHMQDGWGLATDGKVLFGSDGTSTLYQIDPHTTKVIVKHVVKYKGQEVYNLNELEYINGEVWANIWQSDCIARISPKDGAVLGWILLQELREGLMASGYWRIDVLNGIAWDEDKNRIFVTGKLWPKLYEIKVHKLKKPFHGSVEQICMRMPFNFTSP